MFDESSITQELLIVLEDKINMIDVNNMAIN